MLFLGRESLRFIVTGLWSDTIMLWYLLSLMLTINLESTTKTIDACIRFVKMGIKHQPDDVIPKSSKNVLSN